MKRCAIVGATGYTGQELRRLLANHNGLEAAAVMTARPGVVRKEVDIGTLDFARLRDVVLERLATTNGCTHLNDALRALAEVPALIEELRSERDAPTH